MRALKLLLLPAAMLALSGQARAQTLITFNSVPSVGNPILTTLTTDGFTFTSGHFHTVDIPLGVSNGTTFISEEGNGLGLPISMTNGSTFSINGFDGAGVFDPDVAGFPDATFINVLGNFFGGGTISAVFALSNNNVFQTFGFSSAWTNLTSVEFSGSLPGNGNAGIALDNILVNGRAVTVTPEPSSFVLIAAGFAGLAFASRRRRKI